MSGNCGGALTRESVTFVSRVAEPAGVDERLGPGKPVEAVRGCRTVREADMSRNADLPKMQVDEQTDEVRADGLLPTCEPATPTPIKPRRGTARNPRA